MASKLNLKINQGETFRYTLNWKDEAEVAINLTGYTARMQIRATPESSAILASLTTENGGINITNALTGEFKLFISATDTSSFNWVAGVYDLEMVAPNTDVIRLLAGSVSVSKEITR